MTLVSGQGRARLQRLRVLAHRKMLHLRQQRSKLHMRLRRLVVIPRRGGISGQRQLVRQFDARIKLRIIRAEIEIQYLATTKTGR